MIEISELRLGFCGQNYTVPLRNPENKLGKHGFLHRFPEIKLIMTNNNFFHGDIIVLTQYHNQLKFGCYNIITFVSVIIMK